MSDAIPTYELYGEVLPGTDLDFLHCETITSRSSLHGGVIRPHRHADLFQLFYVCRGEVRVTLDGSVFEPNVPCMLAIPSITVHSFTFGEATEGWVVTIPDVLIRRLLAGTPGLLPDLETPHIVDIPHGESGIWTAEALFRRLAEEFTDFAPGRLLSIQACLELILVCLARQLLSNQTPGLAHQGRAVGHARRFRQLVEESFREHWTLDLYARALGMTTTQLNRICRAVFGKPALAIVHGRLLLEARRDLVYTSMTTAEVAYALGFSDPAYFTRFFTRAESITPSEFRRSQHEQIRRADCQDVPDKNFFDLDQRAH
jgi:AraC family transcriptional activator of pobA